MPSADAELLVDGIDLTTESVSTPGGSILFNQRLQDIQQVEIVKGPQSALYGRSAFAGAIQFVSKDPDDVLGGGWIAPCEDEDANETDP